MITALCLNPCIDRTVEIERFTYGGMNRIIEAREDGSGKGVNVAIACRQIGLAAACIGLMGDKAGSVTGRLERAGCPQEYLPAAGPVRVNLKVLDRQAGVITEINEPGVPVAPGQEEALIGLSVRWARRSEYLILTGSIPPACPTDLYARIIEAVRLDGGGCRCVLDAEGEKLALGIAARPYMIKPNRYELELLCGRELPDIGDVDEEARALVGQGVSIVAVSLGGDGAYVTDGDRAYWSPALDVPVRSTVGAGDSMVAGYLRAFGMGLPLADTFVHAVAAASASVMTEGTQLIDARAYEELLERVSPMPIKRSEI